MFGIVTWLRNTYNPPRKSEFEMLTEQLAIAKSDRVEASSNREYYAAQETLLRSRIERIEGELAAPERARKEKVLPICTMVTGGNKPARASTAKFQHPPKKP